MNVVRLGPLNSVVYTYNAHRVWEDLKKKFDKVNGARIQYLYKGIHSLNQRTMIVANYFLKLRDLWDEFDALNIYLS